MCLSDEAKTKLHTLGCAGRSISKIQLSYKLLIGKVLIQTPHWQATLPLAVFELIPRIALYAWEKTDAGTKMNGNFPKNFQVMSKPYADFFVKLMDVIQWSIKKKGSTQYLIIRVCF